VVSNPRKRQGSLAATGRSAYLGSGADRYDSSTSTRGMTEADHTKTFMEFALHALFTCSLASVIATVFSGTY